MRHQALLLSLLVTVTVLGGCVADPCDPICPGDPVCNLDVGPCDPCANRCASKWVPLVTRRADWSVKPCDPCVDRCGETYVPPMYDPAPLPGTTIRPVRAPRPGTLDGPASAAAPLAPAPAGAPADAPPTAATVP